jgi:hypothetical protein
MHKRISMKLTSSISFSSALGIAFIVLKLCGVISWSWLWVLAPLWIPLAIGAGIAVVFAAIAVVCGIIFLIVN